MTPRSETHPTAMLQDQWLTLLQNWSIPPAVALPLYHHLTHRYTAPHRHYHNLDHIAAVLQTLAELRPLARDYPTLQLAAWFHDAIYDPRAADNEEQSAALAHQTLTPLNLPPATITHVQQLILATKTHTPLPNNEDSQRLLDADLAILAAPPPTYDAYAHAVRREYTHLPDHTFRTGRLQLLHTLLHRPRLYHTPHLHTHLTPLAHTNLHREITTLSS